MVLHQSFGLGSQRPSRSQRTPGRLYAREGGLERSLIGDAGLEFKLPLQLTLDVTGFAGAFFDLWDVETLDDLDGQPSGVVRGGGKVVGLETSLTRVFGRHLRGLASYTLSRAERSVGRVTAPSPFDRTHVFNLSLRYDFGRGWSLASRLLYYSGFPGRVRTVREASSPPRTSPYLQVDVQAEKRWTIGDQGSYVALTLGVLNAGLRKDSTDLDCTSRACEENLVGPATIPTLGVVGSL